jgi:glutaredoxin 3
MASDLVPNLLILGNSTEIFDINMQAVTMYTTAVCPYCIRAKQVLKARGVEMIDEIRIDAHPEEREAMMKRTGRRTVPQIYIGDTHVGGCDELMALDAKGTLISLLQGSVSQT